MTSRIGALIAATALTAGAALAQPMLVCPPGAASQGRPCDTFHYHVHMYRTDTRTFVDVYGDNQFSSQAACERARDAQMKRNLAIVDHFRRVKGEAQFEPDRFGPCHCDMTIDKGSPLYLTDTARVAQIRNAEEARLRTREKLLDGGLTTDSPLVRGLWERSPVTPLLGGPRLAPLPSGNAPAAVVTAAADLKSTRAIDTSRPAIASLDLPLVEIGVEAPPTEPVAAEGVAPSATIDVPAPVTDAVVPVETVPPPAPQPPPQPAEVVVETESTPAPPADEPSAEELASAQEAAESFISYETQRIQNVLRASSVIADESVKAKIFEACMQRIQLLSNLRLLIEGSGMKSRLAAAARSAHTEEERMAVVRQLFGDEIAPHWAPKDAADVVLAPMPGVAEPERVLRDAKFPAAQKKRALYLLLAQTQPTEEQRLWLTTVIDTFLQ